VTKTNIVLGAVLFIIVSANFALAQERIVSPMEKTVETSKVFVKTDGVYLLAHGFSIGLGYNISKNSSIEVDYMKYELNNLWDVKYKFSSTSARGDIWFYEPLEARGIYLAAGVIQTTLDVSDRYANMTIDSSDSKFGGLGVIGYQLDYTINSEAYLRAKMGIGAGSGYAASYSSSKQKPEVLSGLLLEGSLSYYF
jgi:hypothetical protein